MTLSDKNILLNYSNKLNLINSIINQSLEIIMDNSIDEKVSSNIEKLENEIKELEIFHDINDDCGGKLFMKYSNIDLFNSNIVIYRKGFCNFIKMDQIIDNLCKLLGYEINYLKKELTLFLKKSKNNKPYISFNFLILLENINININEINQKENCIKWKIIFKFYLITIYLKYI